MYTQAKIMITNISDAIDSFTSSWTCFHVFTPMSGAVAKMASHDIFQYNVLAIDDTHNT